MTTTTQSLPPAITNATGNLLSVYLDTDQSKAVNLNKGHERALAAKLKAISEGLAQNVERKEFDAAARLVQEFVGNQQLSSKALVIFADAFRILFFRDFQVDIPTEVQWGKPRVAPYVEALDEFERQTIVVTDKWRARILSVFLGTLETTTEIQDIPHTTHIHATGQGRLEAQTHDQRHADENTKKHVKHIIRALESVLASYPSDRIIIGGNPEAVGELLHLLPKSLKTRIAGTVHSSMADSLEKVIETALQVSIGSERDDEVRAVDHLLEIAGQQHRAVTGVAGTIDAVREHRLLTLYYAEGLKLAGKTCVACGAIYGTNKPAPCTSCGSHLEDSEDLIDQFLVTSLNYGARIEQVRGTAAEKLRNVGGIGAVLRY
ncbi:MAG TPA: host attachment protein [Terriglobia bacterium]|nr:host attachment protein [Terriglobia bacterium]